MYSKSLRPKLFSQTPNGTAFILTNIICFPLPSLKKSRSISDRVRTCARLPNSTVHIIVKSELLNPEIQTDSLPAGTHTIKVPKDWQQLVTSLPRQGVSSDDYAVTDDNSIIYTVQPGDSVSKIAQRFNVAPAISEKSKAVIPRYQKSTPANNS